METSTSILASSTFVIHLCSASIRCTFYCKEFAGGMGNSGKISFKVNSLAPVQNCLVTFLYLVLILWCSHTWQPEAYIGSRVILESDWFFWSGVQMALQSYSSVLRELPLFGSCPGHYSQARAHQLLHGGHLLLQLFGMFWIRAPCLSHVCWTGGSMCVAGKSSILVV